LPAMKNVVLVPLGLAAWAFAWSTRLGADRRSVRAVIATTTALFVVAQLASRTWLVDLPHALEVMLHAMSVCARLSFAALLGFVAVVAIRTSRSRAWLELPPMVLVAIGLFAQELDALAVPRIWFPFGVGVSRTQLAYAALIVVLFVLLLRPASPVRRYPEASPARVEP
jgi:hypothetical protein